MLRHSPAHPTTQSFKLKNEQETRGTLKLIRHPIEINQAAAQSILVKSFIEEYKKYLEPADIGEGLTTWYGGENSVQAYYEKYFETELEEFHEGKIEYWVEAYIDDVLVGWATFIKEQSDDHALYMNLLVVGPEHQGKGVGSKLVFAASELGITTELSAVNILLRKKNQGGLKFYEGLGFKRNEQYSRPGNFVDMKLLEPLTWVNPAAQQEYKPSAGSKRS